MQFRPLLLLVLSAPLVLAAGSVVRAQSVGTPPAPVEDQGGAFRDTLKRMEIKREEDEHRKLVDRAAQIKQAVGALADEAAGSRLARAAEKKLKEIEKSARQIRSESGGSGDDKPLDPAPASLTDALKRLGEASERLTESMERTSRHVVSASVVSGATEIIQLVKVIRNYLN